MRMPYGIEMIFVKVTNHKYLEKEEYLTYGWRLSYIAKLSHIGLK
jgi:hypothetical protein